VVLIRIQSDPEIQAECLMRNKNLHQFFVMKLTLICVRGTGSYTGTVLVRIFIVVFPGFGRIDPKYVIIGVSPFLIPVTSPVLL
jgi:hypothetical protein